MKRLIAILILGISLSAAMCEKKEEPKPEEHENLNDYGIDVTFAPGHTVHFKQFFPETTDEGMMTAACLFDKEQMIVSFAASNYINSSNSNGYTGGFSISSVTSARAFQFTKPNAAATNTAQFMQRIGPGISGTPSPLKEYSNKANYSRFASGTAGRCDEQEQVVDGQSIDVTTFSADHGGKIEGSFELRIYHKPEDKCRSYEKKVITGSFKLKRVNFG